MIPVKSLAVPSSEQKRLGAFYTPESLSTVLTDWAVRKPTDNILEPSFGRCGFLAAARKRLEDLGCADPKRQIFGSDVDEGAFTFLVDVLGPHVDTDNFRQEDFLDLTPGVSWDQFFEATVGNPPYIPYQAIPSERRVELANRAAAVGAPVGGRASLWAHFVVHAVSFVAPGGRMAWVLPGSFLQADYAIGVRGYLARSFANVLCVLMHQRFFKEEGTEEETVILLARDKKADGFGATAQFIDASSVDELKTIVKNWDAGASVGRPLDARPSFFVIEQCVATIFNKVCERPDCSSLGDYLTTNIGLVTGANTFFVLSEQDRKRHGLGEADTQPVLGKFKAARGASFSMVDHASYMETGGKGHLISTKELPPIGSALRKYLDSFTAEQRENISTFKKRAIWHAPADAKVPDAFLSVMNHDGPRLVLNEARIHCTNTIHRVFFSDGVDDVTRKLLVISLLTSFSQLSAEFVGRRYGSGVLKHEPREAERISILVPKKVDPEAVNSTFKDIDGLLRSGNSVAARASANRLILHKIKGGKEMSAAFELALQLVRDLRRTTRYASGA